MDYIGMLIKIKDNKNRLIKAKIGSIGVIVNCEIVQGEDLFSIYFPYRGDKISWFNKSEFDIISDPLKKYRKIGG